MKDNGFYNKIHRLGRITVVCALISFMAVPFGLAAVNGISMNIPEILKNATNSAKLAELMAEKESLEQQLEEKMDRWVYLNDLKERIQNGE